LSIFVIDPKDAQIQQKNLSRSEASLAMNPKSNFPAVPDDESSKDEAPPWDDPPTIHTTLPTKDMDAQVKKRRRGSKEGFQSCLMKILLTFVCLRTSVEILADQHFLTNAKEKRKLSHCDSIVEKKPRYADNYADQWYPDNDWAIHAFARGIGSWYINPGGPTDFFVSLDSSCPLTACVLMTYTCSNYYSEGILSITSSGKIIINTN
jgi:hypothetical protein